MCIHYLGEDAGRKDPHTLLVGIKLVQPLWKTLWSLKKLNIDLPYDPAIPLRGIHPKE
jgi:hypothetical protein